MREIQLMEESKHEITSLFNYSIFVTNKSEASSKPTGQKKAHTKKIQIEDELGKLLSEYKQSRKASIDGIRVLKQRMVEYEEPLSVKILKEKKDKEREYLERTIIMMELKQLAESIKIIAFKRRLKGSPSQYMFKNRPLLWNVRI